MLCMYMYIQYIHTCIHTYTYIYAYILYIHAHASVHACIPIYIHIHTCMHTYMHTYIHMYVHTYIHTHTHMHAYILHQGHNTISLVYAYLLDPGHLCNSAWPQSWRGGCGTLWRKASPVQARITWLSHDLGSMVDLTKLPCILCTPFLYHTAA